MLGHHLHASETPLIWRFAGWPMMARLQWYLDPLSPHQLKKNHQIWTPSDKTFWIHAGHLHVHFAYASKESSNESEHMHRLV